MEGKEKQGEFRRGKRARGQEQRGDLGSAQARPNSLSSPAAFRPAPVRHGWGGAL